VVVVAVFAVYGLLLIIEGVIAYRGTSGKLGLLSGICSGLISIGAAMLLQLRIPIGASIGLGLMLAMMAVFASRYMKTRAFFPAGLMLIVSLVAMGALVRNMD
jgi:uncharacterized membrane protein (UPF0136 family)